MPNDFYNATGYPASSADGRSVDMRAELLALTAGFDKMPALTGNANKLLMVNASATGLTVLTPANVALSTFTPVLTCGTPGNLTVAYSTQSGTVVKVGGLALVTIDIVTSTFTHTTASGSVSITGIPGVISGSHYGAFSLSGMTRAGYTNFTLTVLGGTSAAQISLSGSAVGIATAVITDFPTTGVVHLKGTIVYPHT